MSRQTGHSVGVPSTLTRPRPLSPSARRAPVLGEAARFLLVGGGATVVDVGAFNLLHYGAGTGPLTAKVASTVLGGVVAFIGNRQWSFGSGTQGRMARQAVLFTLVSVASLLVALLPLAVARYVLGLTSVLDLNVAANVVGLALATALRFWGYRRFVFPPQAAPVPDARRRDGRLAA